MSSLLTPQQIKDLEIVPNMFPSTDKIDSGDGLSMEINYPNNVTVMFESKLTPSLVKHEPSIQLKVKDLNKYQPGHYFTMILSDPDAPSRRDPRNREWLHWIKANMKINEDGSVSMKEVSNVADYMGSMPPKGTGYHRYVFSLFYHTGKLVHLPEHHWGPSNESRAGFLALNFAKNHHMHGPVAIGCFEANPPGKTLVRVTAACTVKKRTLVLCINSVNVLQWKNQFLLWSTINENRIIIFTSQEKTPLLKDDDESLIIITTYAMLTNTGKKTCRSSKQV
nr:unnamed protein product [Naegleria fowleri]